MLSDMAYKVGDELRIYRQVMKDFKRLFEADMQNDTTRVAYLKAVYNTTQSKLNTTQSTGTSPQTRCRNPFSGAYQHSEGMPEEL